MLNKERFHRSNFQESTTNSHTKISGFWLEEYGDLFSDFDRRSYGQRALSYDFLSELKRATKEIKDKVKLKFYVPSKKRSKYDEVLISRRLSDHFTKHHRLLLKERNSIVKFGLAFVILGVIVMIGAAYLLHLEQSSFFFSFAVILLEPAGWFLFWDGLEQIVFESKRINPELEFYRKMDGASIVFYSY